MKTTKAEHGKSGWLHIDGRRIPVESWAMEYEADGQWWNPREVAGWMGGGIARLSRNARRLLRKKVRP